MLAAMLWYTPDPQGERKGIGKRRQVTSIPLPPSHHPYWLNFLVSSTFLCFQNQKTAGKTELERGVTKKTTRLHYLDLNLRPSDWQPNPRFIYKTQWQASTKSITSRKAFCCSNMLFKGTNISSVDWSTNMACLWLNVPLPTSCPLKRTWYPVQQK